MGPSFPFSQSILGFLFSFHQSKGPNFGRPLWGKIECLEPAGIELFGRETCANLFTRSKEVYIQYKDGDTPRKVNKILGFGGPDTLASSRRVVGFFRLKYIGFRREVHRCLPKPTFFRFVFFRGLSCPALQCHGLLLPGAGGS